MKKADVPDELVETILLGVAQGHRLGLRRLRAGAALPVIQAKKRGELSPEGRPKDLTPLARTAPPGTDYETAKERLNKLHPELSKSIERQLAPSRNGWRRR